MPHATNDTSTADNNGGEGNSRANLMALVDRLQAERRGMRNEIDALRRALEESRASNAALTDQAADWDQTRYHFVGQQEYLKQTITNLEALNEKLAAEASLVEAKEREISKLKARTAKLTDERNHFACEAQVQADHYRRLEAQSKIELEEARADVTRTMDEALRKQEGELKAVIKKKLKKMAQLKGKMCRKLRRRRMQKTAPSKRMTQDRALQEFDLAFEGLHAAFHDLLKGTQVQRDAVEWLDGKVDQMILDGLFESHAEQGDRERGLEHFERLRKSGFFETHDEEVEYWNVPVETEADWEAVSRVEEQNTWDMVEADESHDDREGELW